LAQICAHFSPYSDGLIGAVSDRVPLLALLRATPPIEDDVTGLEHTNRVAAKLAAAGWPLAGVDTESL